MLRIFVALAFLLSLASVSVAQNDSMLFEDQGGKQKAPYKIAKNMVRPGSQDKDTKPLDQKTANKAKQADAKPQPPNVTAQRRKELIDFVKAHHPELIRLLNSLNKTRPGQYQSTLRTLDREIKTLQTLEKKSPARYKNSLELWTIKSKVRVLTAHLAMKKNENDRQKVLKQISELVSKEHDLKTKQMREDFEAQTKRVERLKAQLDSLEGDRENLIARAVEKLDKNAQRISTLNKKANEAKKKQAEKDKEKADAKSTDKDQPKATGQSNKNKSDK